MAGKALDKLKRPVEVPVPVQTPVKQEDAGKMFMDHEGTWKRVLKVKDDGRPTSKGSGNFYTLEGVKDPIHADEKGKLTIGRMIIEGKAPPNVPPKEIAAPKKSIIPELATPHGLRKEGISLTKTQQIEDLRNPEAFDQLVKSGSELKVFKSSPTKTFHAIEDKKNEIGQALDKASKKMDNLLTEDEMASSIALHTEELVNKITKKATAGEYTKAQGDKFQDELMEQLDNLTKNIADGTPIFQSIRKIRQGLGKRLRSSDYQGAGPLAGAPKERLMEQVQLFRTLEGDLADKASTRIGSLPESQQKAAGDYLENMKKYSDLSDLGLLMGKTATKSSTATIEAGIAGTAGVLLGGVTGGALGAGGALLRQYLSTSEGKFQLASLLEKGTPTAKQVAKFAKESGVKPTEVLKYLRNQVGMLGGMITEKDQTGE